jgi:hypothetical protein
MWRVLHAVGGADRVAVVRAVGADALAATLTLLEIFMKTLVEGGRTYPPSVIYTNK